MKNENQIFVYLNHKDSCNFIGTFFYSVVRSTEVYSFEYDEDFLKDCQFTLDPDLFLFKGRQFVPNDKKIFGCFSDSCPDRWGRTLLERKEIINAKKENRTPNKLYEIDYLLGIQDFTRSGAFRF